MENKMQDKKIKMYGRSKQVIVETPKRKEREPTLAELLFVKENDWRGYLYWKKTMDYHLIRSNKKC